MRRIPVVLLLALLVCVVPGALALAHVEVSGTAAPAWCLHHSASDGRVVLCLSPAPMRGRPRPATVHGTVTVRRSDVPLPDVAPGAGWMALPDTVSRVMRVTGVLQQYATGEAYILELGTSGQTVDLVSSYLGPHGRVFRWNLTPGGQLSAPVYVLDPGR
jgi:hypothetical protein